MIKRIRQPRDVDKMRSGGTKPGLNHRSYTVKVRRYEDRQQPCYLLRAPIPPLQAQQEADHLIIKTLLDQPGRITPITLYGGKERVTTE